MSFLEGRMAAGGSLIAAALAFGWFWMSSLFALSGPWMLGLALHGLTFVLLGIGFSLTGRRLGLGGWRRPAWWLAAGLVALGSVTGWPLIIAGLLLLGATEITADRLLAGATFALGGILLGTIYLGGTSLGDESRPEPDAAERALAAAGIASTCAGLALIGGAQLRAPIAPGGKGV
jgi:hypothetical protein